MQNATSIIASNFCFKTNQYLTHSNAKLLHLWSLYIPKTLPPFKQPLPHLHSPPTSLPCCQAHELTKPLQLHPSNQNLRKATSPVGKAAGLFCSFAIRVGSYRIPHWIIHYLNSRTSIFGRLNIETCHEKNLCQGSVRFLPIPVATKEKSTKLTQGECVLQHERGKAASQTD